MFELIYPVDPAPILPSLTANSPRDGRLDGEVFPVVEESGLVVGRASRSYCHGGSRLLHPVVHLHIIDREERIYLQKRSMKTSSPENGTPQSEDMSAMGRALSRRC